ncbi:MAG: CheR family methyltransferase [Desulfovermiculus sp.]
MATISPQEFKTLSKYIYSIAGIYLDESKEYLVQSRLNPLLVSFNLASFSELYYKATTDPSGELEKYIIDAVSTNETFFFRDNAPFDLLKFKIIPELIDEKKRRHSKGKIDLSIWSAACSTGQEVYSIAISLLEVLPDIEKYEIKILGSDISRQAITRASYGQYNKLEVDRGLPPEYLHKYFQLTKNGWRIKDFVRSMASFQVINLMSDLRAIGPFDIVFCRNIAIYFSPPDKKKLFSRIAGVLRPRGYLIVGGSESLAGLAPDFESRHYLRGMYYQLTSDQAASRTAKSWEEAPLGHHFPGLMPPAQADRKDSPQPRTSQRSWQQPPSSNAVESGPEQRAQDQQPATGNPPPSLKPQDTGTSGVNEPATRKKRLLSSLQERNSGRKGSKEEFNQKKEHPGGSLLGRLQIQKGKKRSL